MKTALDVNYEEARTLLTIVSAARYSFDKLPISQKELDVLQMRLVELTKRLKPIGEKYAD